MPWVRKAVLDVGSNSVLLVVGEMCEGRLKVVHEASRVTSLGAGVRATGRLSQEGMDSTLFAIRDFSCLASEHGATEIVARATMAARIAKNQSEFFEMAAAQGTPVEILSGEDEADLGFRAVSEDPTFGKHDRISIIDPGGNSTELVMATRANREWTVDFRKSFPIGTLGLRDGVLADESPDSGQILKALKEVDSMFESEVLPEAGTTFVLGATGTNLVTLKKRLAIWDPGLVHGEVLDYEEVGRAVGWLSSMTDSDRANLIGLEKGREKTIHIGALVLERFMHAIHASEVLVSVRGWRHALLNSLLS